MATVKPQNSAFTLDDLERLLNELPLLPAVVTQLMCLDQTGDDYFDEVNKLAERDPPFASRLIRRANSANYSGGHPVYNLQQAAIRLGADSIINLIVSMAVVKVFVPSNPGQKNLWRHSIGTAVAARHIATACAWVKPQEAYLCGLLQDIGRFVLFEYSQDRLDMVEDTHWRSPLQLIRAEKKVFCFDHAELGGQVCRHWQLPQFLTEVVTLHHDYGISSDPLEKDKLKRMIIIMQMAELFSVLMLLNPEHKDWSADKLRAQVKTSCFHPRWHEVPLSAKKLSELAQDIHDETCELIKELSL